MTQRINESLNQRIKESMNLANLIPQKCSELLSFKRFLCEIELSLQSHAHFTSFSFQKFSDPFSFVWEVLKCKQILLKSSSRCSLVRLVHFLSTTSQIEACNRGNRDTPSAIPGAILPEKSKGFRARDCLHPWIRTLPNSYTSQLFDDGWLIWWRGWHDDVVDMMVWMLTMTVVSFLTKSLW